MKNKTVKLNDIEILIIKKNIKNIYIRIDKNGCVTVSAPLFVTQKRVEEFINQKKDWIIKKHTEIINRKENENLYLNGEKIKFGGREYTLKIKDNKGESKIEGDSIIIYCKDVSDYEKRKRAVYDFYRTDLNLRINRMLPELSKRTGLYPDCFAIKNMKTRWGTCNTKTKKIWLNLMLAKYDENVLRYILCHELVHLEIKGHGADFKARLTEICPDWKEIKKGMRQ